MSSGVKKEWYLGGGEWTKAELRGIIRRMKKRGITTDEAIGPRQRVTLTVIRGGVRAGDTHERWHPGESDEYLRAAIARVNGGDMDELRDGVADILTDATDERHNRTVLGDYDPIDEDLYITRILALMAERLTSNDTVREVADIHEALAPHPLMRELLVRGILNTATYAAGIRTAPGDAGVTTGEGA